MISVIISTCILHEMLDLCLESVIVGQSKENQLIVVVDGYYDLYKKVLKKW